MSLIEIFKGLFALKLFEFNKTQSFFKFVVFLYLFSRLLLKSTVGLFFLGGIVQAVIIFSDSFTNQMILSGIYDISTMQTMIIANFFLGGLYWIVLEILRVLSNENVLNFRSNYEFVFGIFLFPVTCSYALSTYYDGINLVTLIIVCLSFFYVLFYSLYNILIIHLENKLSNLDFFKMCLDYVSYEGFEESIEKSKGFVAVKVKKTNLILEFFIEDIKEVNNVVFVTFNEFKKSLLSKTMKVVQNRFSISENDVTDRFEKSDALAELRSVCERRFNNEIPFLEMDRLEDQFISQIIEDVSKGLGDS